MKTGIFYSALRVLGLTLGTCAALVLSTGVAHAKGGGGSGGASCSITTVPTPPDITVGGSVDFDFGARFQRARRHQHVVAWRQPQQGGKLSGVPLSVFHATGEFP